jgi:hypothetical protein
VENEEKLRSSWSSGSVLVVLGDSSHNCMCSINQFADSIRWKLWQTMLLVTAAAAS